MPARGGAGSQQSAGSARPLASSMGRDLRGFHPIPAPRWPLGWTIAVFRLISRFPEDLRELGGAAVGCGGEGEARGVRTNWTPETALPPSSNWSGVGES